MTTSNLKTFAFYLRSSLKNKQYIEKQRKYLIKFAKDNGIDKYKFYVDDGYAGDTMARPDLKKLITDVEAGKIAAVASFSDDRVVKGSFELWKQIKQVFNENDVQFFAMWTSCPMGWYADEIKDIVANMKPTGTIPSHKDKTMIKRPKQQPPLDSATLLGTTTLRHMLNAVYDEKNPLYNRYWYSECGGAQIDFESDPSIGNEVVYVYYHRDDDNTIMTNIEGDIWGCGGSSAGFKGKVELRDIIKT